MLALAFTADDMEKLRHRFAAVASDGRFELFKTSAQHEGDEGRKQHNFPSPEELATPHPPQGGTSSPNPDGKYLESGFA